MSGYYTKQKPYIDDYGIYVPEQECTRGLYKCVMTKDMFIEAYNRWIKKYNPDTLDDCEFMNDWE